jgi:hypothetical protein
MLSINPSIYQSQITNLGLGLCYPLYTEGQATDHREKLYRTSRPLPEPSPIHFPFASPTLPAWTAGSVREAGRRLTGKA